MSINRIFAYILRHLYNLRHNWEQLTDAFYWPAIDLIIWGLTSQYFQETGSASNIVMILLTALIFWQVVWRSQYEITVSLLSEIWSANVVNLFASPLSIGEWIVAVIFLGIIKMIITILFVLVLSFLLYSINLFTFGFILIPFFALLLFSGWWVGLLVAGIILRNGVQTQTLAWAGVYLLMPFSAVYYPVSSLPYWAQKISLLIPTSYIFEGMREAILSGRIPLDKMVLSFGLSCFYLFLAFLFIKKSYQQSCEKGLARLDEGS